MPQAVANGKQALAIVARVGLVVAVEIRHIVEGLRKTEIAVLAHGVSLRGFQRPQRQRERHVLFVGQRLIVKHQHRVTIHAVMKGFGLRGC